MTPERKHRISTVLDRRQPDLTVIADEVHKGRNIAAIMRTCDAVGIDEMHSVQPVDGFRPFRGTALGTEKWVQVCLHDTAQLAIEQCRQQNMQLVATSLTDRAVDFRAVDYTRPTAIILGAENDGVSYDVLEEADVHVTIPMMGMVESFNVSVACAVILLEAQRQRAAAGLYDQPRLAETVRTTRFFQWAHPVIADYCNRKGLEYPPVDEQGEIIDPALWYHATREA